MPHGHGDVHALMKTSNTAQEWSLRHESFFFFFKIRIRWYYARSTGLGVCLGRNFAMNSVCVPMGEGRSHHEARVDRRFLKDLVINV